MPRVTLYRNGRLHARGPGEATALLVVAGRIEWVGPESGCQQFEPDAVVDLAGNWLAPGFVDGHVHLSDTGLGLAADVSAAKSPAHLALILQALLTADDVLVAHGWDDTDWAAAPTADCLPADRPAYVSRVDLHTAVVNPKLLELAPEIRAADGWSDTGLVQRTAHDLARRAVLRLASPTQRLQQSLAALQAFAAHGVVAVHEMAGPAVSSLAETKSLLQKLSEIADLPEVVCWWGEADGGVVAAELAAYGAGGDLFIDGSFGSRTARLTSDYADGAGRGTLYLSIGQITEHLRQAAARGQRTSFHAIGDEAIAQLADAWRLVADEIGESVFSAQQHQIEHAMLVDPRHIPLLRQLNIAASVQPQFDQRWGGRNGMYAQRLGAERAATVLPLRSMHTAGVPLVFGSDAPVTHIDPWLTHAAAMQLHNPQEQLSSRAAFTSATRTAFRRAGRNAGEIAVGAEANFVIWRVPEFEQVPTAPGGRWSSDPRSGTLPIPDLAAGRPVCLRTVRAGQTIYAAPGWT